MGRCTPDDVRILRDTERNAVEAADGVQATQLCTHVSDADAINATRLKALPGATRAFPARDAYGGDSAMLRALNSTCRAPQTLELKEGAQVCMRANISSSLFSCATSVLISMLFRGISLQVKFTVIFSVAAIFLVVQGISFLWVIHPL